MNLTPSVIPKITKLALLLGSDKDGEVVAAARAIDRTLRGAGLDWHDFIAALAPASSRRPANVSPPSVWTERVMFCRNHDAGRLNEVERRFVTDMARLAWSPGRRPPSSRQLQWLNDIFSRLVQEAA